MTPLPHVPDSSSQRASPLDVSILICTRGRTADLIATLGSLATVSAPAGWKIELIVVENASQDGAEEALRQFQHPAIAKHYLFEPRAGKSNALNRAVKESLGSILLFTDDDVRFPKNWIHDLCAPIRSGSADAVAGGVRLAPHLLRDWMDHTHRAWLASTADYLNPAEPSEMCGANMAISHAVLSRVGEFDIELGPGRTAGGEESLLSWQIKQAGFRLVGALDIAVEHHLASTRLTYRSWRRTATLQGHTRAYLLYHWFHEDISWPLAKYLYLGAKLSLRRLFTKRYAPEDDGMPPWELSYRQDMAKCLRFRRERLRPRKYSSAVRLAPAPVALARLSCNQHG